MTLPVGDHAMTATRLAYGIVTMLLALLLLEGAVRLWGYSEMYIYDPIYAPFDSCDTPLVVHKPNLSNAHARAGSIVHTDSLGLRSEIPAKIVGEKRPDTIRIAIVGDSVTFGHGIPNAADVYPAVLEKRLSSESAGGFRYEVLNFGVSAYSLVEMTATLKCRMVLLKPDIVVCAFIMDDFDPGRMVSVDEFGYTNDPKLGWGKNRFPLLKNMLRHWHLTYLIRDALFNLRGAKTSRYNDATIDQSYRHLKEFKMIASQYGSDCFFVLLPSYGSDDLSKIAERLDRDGLQYLNLSTIWRNYSLDAFSVGKRDSHPSAAVHKEIANSISCYIKTNFGPKFSSQKGLTHPDDSKRVELSLNPLSGKRQ